MAPALALIFILVLAGQSASASSIGQSISNGQHKSIREDYNPLSRNRRESWWWMTTKSTLGERDSYIKSCKTDSDCSVLYSGMWCQSRQCACPSYKKPNYVTQSCEYKDNKERPLGSLEIGVIVFGSICGLVTVGWIIVKLCDDSSDRSNLPLDERMRRYTEARAIIRRMEERSAERQRALANGLPPVSVSALTNTSSSFHARPGNRNDQYVEEFLRPYREGEASMYQRWAEEDRASTNDLPPDFPPDYTDVYMEAPQEKADEQENELPTYDQVEKQPEWNSQPVFVITPHSSGEEPGPHSFGAAGASAHWEERDSSLSLRTDDHQLQNHGYHVDRSESDGHTNHDYGTFD